MAKAKTLAADSIVLDLEDGVPMDKKGKARQLVFDALEVRSRCHRIAPKLTRESLLK